MSLMVAAMLRDPKTGEVSDDPRVQLASQLGGFEEWRVSVWASDAVRRRGATFLPRLNGDDLYIEAEDLQAFLSECRHLLEDAEAIGTEVGWDAHSIEFRLKNFIAAAQSVDPQHGVVYIG